jgi:hypothetical protein
MAQHQSRRHRQQNLLLKRQMQNLSLLPHHLHQQ